LIVGCFAGAAVVDDGVREGELWGDVGLGGDSLGGIGVREVVACHEALGGNLRVADDHPDRIAVLV
jgi:hypothetical protein